MALDEPKENDKVFEKDELKFMVEEGLLDSCGSIKIDFVDAGPRSGFSVSSQNPIGGGSSACGTCSTC